MAVVTDLFQVPKGSIIILKKAVTMRTRGRLASWDETRGYGFITPAAGGKRIFVHIKAFGSRRRRPVINQEVTYTLSADRLGRPCAANVTLAGERHPHRARRYRISAAVTGAAVFMLVVGIAALSAKIPPLIFGLYVIASGLAYIMYAADKSAAVNGTARIPESTLHLLSLAGGWPGALIARQKLRHKTKKQPFRSVFRVTVFVNTATFVWLLTPTGLSSLRSVISGLAAIT